MNMNLSVVRWVGFSLLIVSLCTACGKRENVEKVLREDALRGSSKPAPIRPLALVGLYEGILPTDDPKTSSKTLIDLRQDATFTLNKIYIRSGLDEKSGKQPEANGSWIVNADQTLIQLQVDSAVPGNISCFSVRAEAIVKYDNACKPLNTQRPEVYMLKKIVPSQPVS
jgi:NlpE N-terminal domain